VRVLVVLAHPRRDSFNAALAEALCEGLRRDGHEPDLADLYEEGFRPDLTAEDLRIYQSGAVPPDVAPYHARIGAARGLAFVFPVWWFGMPAVMKGFVDRVLFEGFAFRFRASGMAEGLLTHPRALVLNTTGVTATLYRTMGFGRPLKRSFDSWTLRMCGIREVKRVLFYDVVNAGDDVRAGYLGRARRLGATYFKGPAR
jgi:NAD(P)H dehydrogenase (quinone)